MLLLSFIFITTYPLSLTEVEALADRLYAASEFDAAALEYKRCMFLSSFDSTAASDAGLVPLKLSLALYRNGERNEADSILYAVEGPVVRMVRAALLMEEGDPYLAARAIDSSTCAALGTPAYRLRGWAYTEAKDFSQAAAEFRKAGDDSLALMVEALKGIKLKNPNAARWLSLLPGLGEAYAGKPLFGLWAFLVNAGDTYLIVNALLTQRYLDALLVYNFLWQRFYTGSMANADRFAKQYDEKALKAALDPIRDGFNQAGDMGLDLETLNVLSRLSMAGR